MSKKPEFVKIGPGIGLGYRRNSTAGTWVVRVADGSGANWTRAIGHADDFDASNDSTILDYWQAQDRAKAEARSGEGAAPVDAKSTTLRDALDQYEADLKTRGGDVGNAVRIRRHLNEKLLTKRVVDLTLNDLRRWRDNLTSKRRRTGGADEAALSALPLKPSGVNRICSAMKAALNLAADRDGRITTRRPWEQGLKSFSNADEPRNVILSDLMIRNMVEFAPTQGAGFGLLTEALAVTGSRISQLARANIGDLQDSRIDPRIMVPSSKKGNGRKAILRRPVPISPEFGARLRAAAGGRPADAPLFTKPSGARWADSDHSRLFDRIVKATGVTADDGAKITISALRHSSIVRQLVANVPVRVVAALHDTSVAIIERTYSRHIADHTDAMARAAMFTAS